MGHHLIGEQTSSSSDPLTLTTARNKESAPLLETSAEWVIPAEAVEQLRDCIGSRKNVQKASSKLRAAVAVMGRDAHKSNVVPERFVISIKELCHSLPEYERMRGSRERAVFLDRVVTLAIEEYYRR